MARILVIEDETTLAEALRQGLADELHAVDVAHDGDEGLWAAQGGEHDLIVLDVMLPGIDGMEICSRLRTQGLATPILMLTARDAVTDVVRGLDAGADDYVTKPFRFDELLARVRALLRAGARSLSSVVEVDDVVVDLTAHRASRAGEELRLTAQEMRLLEHLALHAGQIAPRSAISAALWSHDDDPDSNVLEVVVSSLRRKMEEGGGARLVHTVRGAGYTLRAEAP